MTALDRLQAIVGEPHLLTETARLSDYRVDGQAPLAVAFPGSLEEVAALLHAAGEARLSVLLRGAGRHLHLGSPPAAVGLVVSLARLNRLVEYDADNLTITAQAGMTLASLRQIVGERGQLLPLDPPGPDDATLGGLASTNLAGALRMTYGAPRDLVIGMRVSLPDGDLIKTGGKTMKNVAGYELGRLFLGSLGCLGAIVELTLRLIPTPAQQALIAAALPPDRAAALARELVGSQLDLTSIELATPHAAAPLRRLPITPGEGWVLLVRLLGEPEGLARQERELRALVGPGCVRLDGEDAAALCTQLSSLMYPRLPAAVVLRSVVPIAEGGGLMDRAARAGWPALARVGDGVVLAAAPAGEQAAKTGQTCEALRAAAHSAGGYAVLESGPLELKRAFPVWGPEVPNLDLMQQIKRAFDPNGVLGCGRFVPGV